MKYEKPVSGNGAHAYIEMTNKYLGYGATTIALSTLRINSALYAQIGIVLLVLLWWASVGRIEKRPTATELLRQTGPALALGCTLIGATAVGLVDASGLVALLAPAAGQSSLIAS